MMSGFAFAEETKNQNQQEEESLRQKIINLWHKDAAPFLQGVACSFKTDVWDKTANWIEKSKNQNQVSDNNNKNDTNPEDKDKKCTFFETIHKAFTGKDNTAK